MGQWLVLVLLALLLTQSEPRRSAPQPLQANQTLATNITKLRRILEAKDREIMSVSQRRQHLKNLVHTAKAKAASLTPEILEKKPQAAPFKPKPLNKPKPLTNLEELANKSSSNYYAMCRKVSVFAPQTMPVYFINLDNSTRRRATYHKEMARLGFPYVHRVRGRLPSDNVPIDLKIAPHIPNEPKEMYCLVSHLIAIYTAVHDSRHKDTPYALITEDDVLLEMDANFTALALAAPSGFGVIQIMTSNAHEVQENYKLFEKEAIPWSMWDINKHLWSTQAYMISKAVARPFIDRVVVPMNVSGKIRFRINIVNPSPQLFPCSGKRAEVCFYPYRIVADNYLYLALSPAYFSRVPIFNGAKVESTIHSKASKTHAAEFDAIGKVIDAAAVANSLPGFIKPFRCTNATIRPAMS